MPMYPGQPAYPPLIMDEVTAAFTGTEHGRLVPINLGKGVSSFNPFDHVDTGLCRARLGAHVGYGDITGLESLRRLVAEHYQQTCDYDLSPGRVCITDGASGALTIALAMLLESGAELILPDACYPAYALLARMFNARVRRAPMRDRGPIDVERLPRAISRRTKAILVDNPGNPHGGHLDADEIECMTELGVPVVFDEVYQPLPLGDQPVPSAIRHADRHLIVGSLSKSLAIAGFRVGYLIVPEAMVGLMTNVKAVLNMCTSLPSQLIAEGLLAHWDRLLAEHRAMLRRNWALFRATALDAGLRLRTAPEAGFFAVVEVGDADHGTRALALDLARHHALGVAPGADFQPDDSAFLRLNFACPTAQIEPGVRRLGAYLAQQACANGCAASIARPTAGTLPPVGPELVLRNHPSVPS